MKAEIINPILEATFKVFEKLLKMTPQRGKIRLESSPLRGEEVNAIVGVTGDISGQFIFSTSPQTSIKLAATLLSGTIITEFDELVKSAIRELANIITGNAISLLAENGFRSNMTPPTLFVGKEVMMSSNEHFLVVPLTIPYGEININISLQEAGG